MQKRLFVVDNDIPLPDWVANVPAGLARCIAEYLARNTGEWVSVSGLELSLVFRIPKKKVQRIIRELRLHHNAPIIRGAGHGYSVTAAPGRVRIARDEWERLEASYEKMAAALDRTAATM